LRESDKLCVFGFKVFSFSPQQKIMRKKMKKNLLTLMFIVTFLCFGATFASAKTSSASGNSVSASKKLSPAKNISNKINALKAKCAMQVCASQLDDLIDAANHYEIICGGTGYPVGCGGAWETYLINAAAIYELCLAYNSYLRTNTDKKMDRNTVMTVDKRRGSNV
jgi:hypothetical protein